MMKRVSAPGYDLFKLVVTLILVGILLLMLLRGCATSAASPLPTEESSVTATTQTSEPPEPTETTRATSTVEEETPSPAPSVTVTSAPTDEAVTPTPDSTTPTPDPITQTPDSTVTQPATTDGTPTAVAAGETSCNTIVPSRLSVGQTARVVQRLNMRDAANILAPIIQVNPTNREVEIIGGPVCTPVGDKAYLWWQIRVPGGLEGWSAESPLNEATYLLEPIQ